MKKISVYLRHKNTLIKLNIILKQNLKYYQ